MREMVLDAEVNQLDLANEFMNGILEENNASMKMIMQMDIALEEIFVNIASYAYPDEIGTVTIQIEVKGDPKCIYVTLLDQGEPYDPLKKDDPDVIAELKSDRIGGLGIFMVKKTMDDVLYEYKNQTNCLTLVKEIM